MSLVNSDRYAVLELATVVSFRVMLPAGLNFLEQVSALLARIMEVAMHCVRHGAVAAQAVAHLLLQPEVDLHEVQLGFSLELLENIDVG